MNVVERADLSRWSDVDIIAATGMWLEKFENALQGSNQLALSELFLDDSHWRDLVAFTWHNTAHNGANALASAFIVHQASAKASAKAHNFHIAPNRNAPRVVRRLGIEVIEAFYDFETEVGRGTGVLRLRVESGATLNTLRAWVISTTLQELKGFEKPIDSNRPSGDGLQPQFRW
jgi:hypothetical protein